MFVGALLNTIGKVFDLPPSQSHTRSILRRNLSELMSQSEQLDAQTATQKMRDILARLPRLTVSPSNRIKERCATIVNMLNTRRFVPTRILDIGAGNTDITLELKQHYRLPMENIFVLDPKMQSSTEVTTLSYVDGKIPLPDKSIDLVIMFVVLHHIPPEQRETLVAEIARVLSDKGMLLIREHDNDNTREFKAFIEAVHTFWYVANNESYDPLFLMSRTQTQELMRKYGFTSRLFLTYSNSNPQQLYHELYVKETTV